ncbi:tRNA pseudouridine(13) synthase TruD [Halarcobacter ebronensis]|uniref:tRNA pseudouridine synthase D n=1 Tax=Halarcobacter ebronensis TaxID=1462615 RepID=A0A4Q1APQ9_9BACT|nr:tRNA pseudouridine(13) synthase TruD [Halarcobacter ebronensis]QKF80858.1 tRNA pseudouridine 13 synthase [Halarcobacter ebronensis]RXK08648.1 pseudouridine synthase [Halarcobacter ebronensis]
MNNRVFIQKHKPLTFDFFQNKDDFIVEENPIKFSGRGNFIVAKIRKENYGTWDLIEKLSKQLKIYENEIGYAGLKDKNATTTQYISIPKKYSKELKRFKAKNIEILDTVLHTSKLNIGDLEGNKFSINLHKVEEKDLIIIEKLLKEISLVGVPNYFGYQRFGNDALENIEKAKALIYGDLVIRDNKMAKMLISIYQSSFFNSWLANRVLLSENSFKLFDGDIFKEYSNNKLFTAKTITQAIQKDFEQKKVVPTGLLPGRKVFRSVNKARELEEKYDDLYIQEKGFRRDALVYPKEILVNYNRKDKKLNLSFSLPKSSYATVLIENLANKNF